MKRDELLKILRENGWTFKEGKKHTTAYGPEGKITRVWRHTKDIPTGTLKEIEKQTGLKLS